MNHFIDDVGHYLGAWDQGAPTNGILVDTAPSNASMLYLNGSWVVAIEQIANEARQWRDSELARADVELNKVQDGMGVGTVTQWRAYRVALRNWPITDGWPESTKPVSPDYKE